MIFHRKKRSNKGQGKKKTGFIILFFLPVPLRVRQEGRSVEGVCPRGPRALRRRARRGQEEVQDALRGHGEAGRPARRGAEARQGEAPGEGEGQTRGQAGTTMGFNALED